MFFAQSRAKTEGHSSRLKRLTTCLASIEMIRSMWVFHSPNVLEILSVLSILDLSQSNSIATGSETRITLKTIVLLTLS